MLQLLDEAMDNYQLKEICILHAGVKDHAHKWKEEIEKLYTELKINIQTLVPVAGVHTGYGTLCIAWLRE
ncbi:hypothetical protein JCM21714_3811 [Gracilibacillus boraciitolerans JCM 21714]|uniref:DegV family protein n=1 Tax=Gracilibacillus boraciitolerans JCM 21714 TaxID=1298598 RepID=W4VMJ6_9BACI|nr:hypothetical protein JCM21714_3811 [Gracilibacillus boraciitolerans JCM 21714]